MKRITPLFLLLAALCIGCAHVSNKSSADNRYERLANDFVTGQFAFEPLTGVALGWNQYDGRYVVPDQQALAAEDNRLKRFESEFAALPANQLTPVGAVVMVVLDVPLARPVLRFDRVVGGHLGHGRLLLMRFG